MQSNLKKWFSTIKNSAVLSKLFSDTSWTSLERLVKIGINNALAGLIVYAYLPKDDLGLINFSFSIVAILIPISSMGMERLFVVEAVKHPEKTDTLLTSGFVLRLITSFLLFGISLMAYKFLRPTDTEGFKIMLAVGFYVVINPLIIFSYPFLAHSRIKKNAISRIIGNLVAAILKILFVVLKLPIFYYALIFAIEILVSGVFYIIFFYQSGYRFKLGLFKKESLIYYLSAGWPLIFAGLATMIYQRIDQIFIGKLWGNEALADYGFIVTISEAFNFLALTVVVSMGPHLVKRYQDKDNLLPFYRTQRRMYGLIILLGFVVVFGGIIILPFIFELFKDGKFLSAVPILKIYIFSVPLTFITFSNNQNLVIEGKQKVSTLVIMLGTVVNILLNFLWVPDYGSVGAAYATVISYSISSIFGLLLFRGTRKLGVMVLSIPIFYIREINNFILKKRFQNK